ncbi:MAG: hypothetical protein ACE5F9_14205 [Phycisphaerae bacterium]
MLRILCRVLLTVAFVIAVSGCAENEATITQKRESKTESTPTDASPGTMVVE